SEQEDKAGQVGEKGQPRVGAGNGEPGIGPRRRRALLRRFGSLAGVRRATRDELIGVVGAKAADAVLAYFAAAPR
ncbi:MAG: helix-hairpin-helix domain-containing protein, partial [Vicinamibacterales bacterium]